jgi:hypothetical protein
MYIPLPSLSSTMTLRPGQAIAAPAAQGSAYPMEPPVGRI